MPALTHISYKCRDLQATERFYTQHFGFRRCRVFNPGPNQLVLLKLGAMRLELGQAPANASVPPANGSAIGYAHLAFEVDDLDAAVRALNAAGVETGAIRDCSSALAGMSVCFFKDPDGNSVELMQGYHDDDAVAAR